MKYQLSTKIKLTIKLLYHHQTYIAATELPGGLETFSFSSSLLSSSAPIYFPYPYFASSHLRPPGSGCLSLPWNFRSLWNSLCYCSLSRMNLLVLLELSALFSYFTLYVPLHLIYLALLELLVLLALLELS